MKETLSDKKVNNYNGIDMGSEFFLEEDVKEFIKSILVQKTETIEGLKMFIK